MRYICPASFQTNCVVRGPLRYRANYRYARPRFEEANNEDVRSRYDNRAIIITRTVSSHGTSLSSIIYTGAIASCPNISMYQQARYYLTRCIKIETLFNARHDKITLALISLHRISSNFHALNEL